MARMQASIFWTILLSESLHIVCCVLPVLVSAASLLAGLGATSILPAGIWAFHDFMHHWEIPLIAMSGTLLALGWGLWAISRRLDCRTAAGCCHEPCAPRKKATSVILIGATVLFLLNTTVYLVLHAA